MFLIRRIEECNKDKFKLQPPDPKSNVLWSELLHLLIEFWSLTQALRGLKVIWKWYLGDTSLSNFGGWKIGGASSISSSWYTKLQRWIVNAIQIELELFYRSLNWKSIKIFRKTGRREGGGEDGGGEKFGRGRGWGKVGNRFALCKGKKRAEWNIIIFSLFSISWGIF